MPDRCPTVAYFAGAVAARTGDETAGPALLLAAFAATGSTAGASFLLAGMTAAAAAGGPLLGALLDRRRRPGRLLALALLGHAAGLGAVVAGLGRLPFAAVMAVAVLTGLLGPALSGGWTAQLPRPAARGRLARVNALDAMTFHLAGLAGPALAGGTAHVLGAPAAVAVAAALIGLAAPAAWSLAPRPGRARNGPGTSVAGDLAAGLRAIVRRPRLARATLSSVVSCAAQGVLVACLPLLGERVLGDAGRGAALLSCSAAAALLAGALLARFPGRVAPDTLVWAGALVQAAALALAASGRPDLLIAAVLVAGLGEGPQLIGLFAVRHREAPDHLRGQVFTTGASLKIAGFAIGAALAGPVAARSLPGALGSGAVLSVLAALAFLAVRPSGSPRGERAA
ncbi:MFS transporter [Streptomyces marincola]|uniref:MFS transporter n=1 Tax=Streptomyces marincola TaxID=2878388 RepID=UPI001CF1B3C8|nr:MFS transporter [Streptomyces marincola]UCM91289.1 MFS transporter [Streptomyces marincola]